MTLKAMRALREAGCGRAFRQGRQRQQRARTIAAGHLRPGVAELPLLYPVTTEIPTSTASLSRRHRRASTTRSRRGHRRASRRRTHGRRASARAIRCSMAPTCISTCGWRRAIPTEVVAGVTGMSGCWSSVGAPIAQGDDVFTVLPGTLPEDELTRRLADTDAAVVMKLGRNLPKVRRALARSRPARSRALCRARHDGGRARRCG